MASNYQAICSENRESYGTKGALKAGELAGGLYDDRTHFIFELLQNAEDALRRRGDWSGSREVSFILSPSRLTLSHFGKPFDEADVRSVCNIAESTKDASSIGRFGLGFKSVYTVTDLPEIHSGDEDFAIEGYVYPRAMARTPRHADETQIVLPLKRDDVNVWNDIATGFRQLGARALLFLRHIDAVSWQVEGGPSARYERKRPEALSPNVQRITLLGEDDKSAASEQSWLVFHRELVVDGKKLAGRAEIAFSLAPSKDAPGRWTIRPLVHSPLVVFFPTVVETHLGFLVQGPFRTTPSRDNVPAGDAWNQRLIGELSTLLVEAMRWLRDEQMLDVSAMGCLPLSRERFAKGTRFAPAFQAVRQAFLSEPLLPTYDGRFATAKQAKLSRTQELRELIGPSQLSSLYGSETRAWLSADITQDRAPEVRQYVMNELEMEEVTPLKLVPLLTKSFLALQHDGWVLQLYEFLVGQEQVLQRYLETFPLIRLEDGTHVAARVDGKPAAFLPGEASTGFPTVRAAVCDSPRVRLFLRGLGLSEPDPVDDVIRNVLTRYQGTELDVDDATYANDIERILKAFQTDSQAQRERLRSALSDTTFLAAIDAASGEGYYCKPGEVYLATDRLEQLFAGVPDVMLVDQRYECLRGEAIRDLLVAAGSGRTLALEAVESRLTEDDLSRMRRSAGLERATSQGTPKDATLRGLAGLLNRLAVLAQPEAAALAQLLWDALVELASRNEGAFSGSYQWSFGHQMRTVPFDAHFVELLNQTRWIPTQPGQRVQPGAVLFETLGWKPHPFLQSKIVFKAPKVDQLAEEAGIDPAVIALLMRNPAAGAELLRRDAKAAAMLVARGQGSDESNSREASIRGGEAADDATSVPAKTRSDQRGNNPSGADSQADEPDTSDASGDKPFIYKMVRSEPENDTSSGDAAGGGTREGGGRPGKGAAASTDDGDSHVGSGMNRADGAKGGATGNPQAYRPPGSVGGRPFISYVGAHPEEEDHDPDGVDQAERMRIEACAIDLILAAEPALHRTPAGNPGFDLYEADALGRPVRWVEVKAMTGTLQDRPVGLSHTQFDLAREKREAYWLYVVEQATDPTRGRVLRIQNPAGFAKTFTFDHGWLAIAKTEPPR